VKAAVIERFIGHCRGHDNGSGKTGLRPGAVWAAVWKSSANKAGSGENAAPTREGQPADLLSRDVASDVWSIMGFPLRCDGGAGDEGGRRGGTRFSLATVMTRRAGNPDNPEQHATPVNRIVPVNIR